MKYLSLVILLVALCAIPPALAAEKPPEDLLKQVSSHRLVYDKQCKYQGQEGIECLIFLDTEQEVVWVVLFDDKLNITRVISAKEGVETIHWCRSNMCI